jgi:dephospho-CoA kinase
VSAFILGLTGSVGSGKSTVSSMMRDLGYPVVCADELAREATAPGAPALDEIARTFGPSVLRPTGELDRAALAKIVFQDSSARRTLEAIVHPRVRAREVEEIERLRPLHPLVVLDVPLLFEAGAQDLCDAVAVVTVPEDVRRQRLAARGMAPEDIARRLAAQMPQDEKARRADHEIDNSGTLEATRAQVQALVRRILEGPDFR